MTPAAADVLDSLASAETLMSASELVEDTGRRRGAVQEALSTLTRARRAVRARTPDGIRWRARIAAPAGRLQLEHLAWADLARRMGWARGTPSASAKALTVGPHAAGCPCLDCTGAIQAPLPSAPARASEPSNEGPPARAVADDCAFQRSQPAAGTPSAPLEGQSFPSSGDLR